MNTNLKWDKRYLNIAKEVSKWSKDPSTKVGAVIVGNQGQIISQGFNGFARGVDDFKSRYENREIKYKYIIHAEMNCLYNAIHNGSKVHGCTIYVHGLPVCHECAKGMIQSGIKRVVMDTKIENTKWSDSAKLSIQMFDEAGVIYEFIEGGDE